MLLYHQPSLLLPSLPSTNYTWFRVLSFISPTWTYKYSNQTPALSEQNIQTSHHITPITNTISTTSDAITTSPTHHPLDNHHYSIILKHDHFDTSRCPALLLRDQPPSHLLDHRLGFLSNITSIILHPFPIHSVGHQFENQLDVTEYIYRFLPFVPYFDLYRPNLINWPNWNFILSGISSESKSSSSTLSRSTTSPLPKPKPNTITNIQTINSALVCSHIKHFPFIQFPSLFLFIMHPNLRTMVLSPSTPMLNLIRTTPRFLGSCRSIHATAPLRFACTAPLFVTPTIRRSNVTPVANSKITFKRPIAMTAMAPDGAMFSHPAPEPGMDFNVVMIGAGVSLLQTFQKSSADI
jgi:hypothetical protein